MTALRESLQPGGGSEPSATRRLFDRQRFGARPGLDVTRALLARLDDPQREFASILIAGTNGKGSTSAVLHEILQRDGGTVARFVSPHLTRPGERFRVGDRDADDDAVERLAAEVLPHADAVGATFFEVLVAMACLYFARAGASTAVMEVGMGGRLDATNALDPVASAVAQIALDHAEVLGSDLASIAREKAGVLRPGRPAWSSAEGVALDALRSHAADLGTPLRVGARAAPGEDGPGPARSAADATVRIAFVASDGTSFALTHRDGRTLSLRTPMVGPAAAHNAALAACLAADLGASDASVVAGTAAARWPGRFERVLGRTAPTRGEPLWFDGAHNPAAAAALAQVLVALAWRPTLVLGASQDKDVEGIAAALAPVVGTTFVTRARTSPRAEPPDRLAARAAEAGLAVASHHDDPREAVRAARAWATDGAPVLVAGSLYLVGELRAWWTGETLPGWERWQ
ncbi:MAG: bifunctional folylpolyglutamate synthase/dihydrofolate synthase [Trueperaceae bacterium]